MRRRSSERDVTLKILGWYIRKVVGFDNNRR